MEWIGLDALALTRSAKCSRNVLAPFWRTKYDNLIYVKWMRLTSTKHEHMYLICTG
jgi:hypothetical protein